MEGGFPAAGGAGQGPELDGYSDRRWLLRGGIVLAVILIALVAWLATRGSDDDGSSEPAAPAAAAGPRIVSGDELSEAAEDLGQPVYWAGEIDGTELELVELGGAEGGVQVRYVPEGSAAGETAEDTLTVGSYPLADPQKSLEGFAKRPESTEISGKDGQELVISSEAPTSVYFVPSGNEVQVEVYAPTAKRALTLASSGQVEQVP